MENRTRRLVLGGLLIVIGLRMLGDQSGWWDLGSILELWPLALVAVGFSRGVTTGPGLLWIGYGIVLLLSTTGVWALRDSWPVLLVLHGAVLLSGRSACDAHQRRAGRNELHVG